MIDWKGKALENGFPKIGLLLAQWYTIEGLTGSEIAQKLGVSIPSVLTKMTKGGISKRRRGGANNVKDLSTGKEK